MLCSLSMYYASFFFSLSTAGPTVFGDLQKSLLDLFQHVKLNGNISHKCWCCSQCAAWPNMARLTHLTAAPEILIGSRCHYAGYSSFILLSCVNIKAVCLIKGHMHISLPTWAHISVSYVVSRVWQMNDGLLSKLLNSTKGAQRMSSEHL